MGNAVHRAQVSRSPRSRPRRRLTPPTSHWQAFGLQEVWRLQFQSTARRNAIGTVHRVPWNLLSRTSSSPERLYWQLHKPACARSGASPSQPIPLLNITSPSFANSFRTYLTGRGEASPGAIVVTILVTMRTATSTPPSA